MLYLSMEIGRTLIRDSNYSGEGSPLEPQVRDGRLLPRGPLGPRERDGKLSGGFRVLGF